MSHLIALAQVNTSNNLDANLARSISMIKEARQKGASLIAFPESFLFLGQDESEYLGIAETIPGPLIQQFCTLARSNQISILLGGFCERHPSNLEKTYNSSILIDRQGAICAIYRKIHLFDSQIKEIPLEESKTVAPGKELVCIHHEIGQVGLSICYDLRFPGVYHGLRAQGAQVIFVPAAFTYPTGKFHWFPLLQARAIETQSYIVAPAQVGQHNNRRRSFGHSLLIDPWGRIIADGGPDQTGLIFGEVDLQVVAQIREQMPVFEHQVSGIDWN